MVCDRSRMLMVESDSSEEVSLRSEGEDERVEIDCFSEIDQ